MMTASYGRRAAAEVTGAPGCGSDFAVSDMACSR